MVQKKQTRPNAPHFVMNDGSRERYEEITDGYRFDTFRHCNAIPSHTARLRIANDASEPHLWQVVTDTYKIIYFDRYKDAMAYLTENGYIPKPKRKHSNFAYWTAK